MTLKTKKINTINIVSLLIILTGIIMHIIPYFYNRSLWVDEAMLASSIGTRGLGNLVASPLDYGQSAPIGYLYIVKLLTMIFGTSKTVLRIWSLISFIGVLCFFYLILKLVFELKYSLLFTGFLSVMPYYIRYSNELKQYMSDCMFVLLAVLLFGLYLKNKLSLKTLCISYALIIWFSFSAVFFIAAGMIYLVISKIWFTIKNKNFSRADVKYLLLCFLVAISFIFNYVFWLSKTSDNAGGEGYWNLLKFPIIPTSLSDLKLIYKMLLEILLPFQLPHIRFDILVLALDIYAAVRLIVKKDSKLLLTVLGSGMLMLIASAIGFFPIKDRLVFFISVLLLLFAFIGVEDILMLLVNFIKARNNKIIHGLYYTAVIIAAALSFMLPIRTSAIRIMPNGIYAYKTGSEISESLSYLDNIVTTDDNNIYIYIYYYSIPTFMYEKEYPLGDGSCRDNVPYETGNYILGQSIKTYNLEEPYSYENKTNYNAIKEDVSLIKNHDSVYLFTSHMDGETDTDWLEFLDELKKYGDVDIVNCSHETYLYHFQKNAE